MPVWVIDTLKPKNGLDFPVVEGVDVEVSEGLRLPEALAEKADVSALEETNAAVLTKANSDDVATEVNNLQSQINSIITPVTSEAEVINARVASDGTAYTTLKERLDTESTEIKGEIESIGALAVSFDIASGAEHSSQLDRIKFPIKTGESIYVTIITDPGIYNGTVFLYPSEATTGGVNVGNALINKKTKFTSAGTYEYIGVYLDDVAYNRHITVVVERETSSISSVADIRIAKYFTFQPDINLEIGNIQIGSSGPVYSNNTKRVRLAENEKVHLQPGDIIGLTSYTDAEFYIGWQKTDGTYGYKNGWNSKDYLISEEGNYYFVLRNKTEVEQQSTEALGSLLFIDHTAKPSEFTTPENVSKISSEIADNAVEAGGSYDFIPLIMPSANYVTYNSESEILTIPRDTIIVSKRASDGYIVLSTVQNIDLSVGGSTAVKVLYDFNTNEFVVKKYSVAHDSSCGIIAVIRKLYQGTGTVGISGTFPYAIDGYKYGLDGFDSYQNSNVKSINHRGYNTVAPENTLPAFKLSKKMGFDYVETDISFTSDHVPVLLHDSTVDRTSNGSGEISSFTLEEVKQLDFGSWKSEEYAGTKIPTLDEFISLCRNIGLHPYLELKTGDSAEDIQNCCDIVRIHGMRDNVTWISYSSTLLGYVKEYEPTARLGLLADTVSSATIQIVQSLKTDSNNVFIDGSSVSSEMISAMASAGIPLETWVINTEASILSKPDYNTGFTTDKFHAGKVLAKNYGN